MKKQPKKHERTLKQLREERIQRLNRTEVPACASCGDPLPKGRKYFCSEGCQLEFEDSR